MKKMKCPDCDPSIETYYEGGSAEEVMKTMYPHYVEEHQAMIASADPEKMQVWMAKFKADFEATPDS